MSATRVIVVVFCVYATLLLATTRGQKHFLKGLIVGRLLGRGHHHHKKEHHHHKPHFEQVDHHRHHFSHVFVSPMPHCSWDSHYETLSHQHIPFEHEEGFKHSYEGFGEHHYGEHDNLDNYNNKIDEYGDH